MVRAAAEGFLDVATAALKSKKAAATGTGTGTGEVGVIDAAARRDIMAARENTLVRNGFKKRRARNEATNH